jgi:hypothetical protein
MGEADDIVPEGYRYVLVMATIFKRVLANDPATIGERLEMLEALNAMVDAWFTTEALTALAPADDATMAIVREAWKLDGGNPALSPSFAVLIGSEVFDSLVRANPSIAAAIKLCTQGRDRAPAPQRSDAPQPPAQSTGQDTPYIDPRLHPPAEPQRAEGVDFSLF